ncbi:hypothetical protein SDRG_13837 [Saprolegnia diclina VS20]|uniref:SET domain-containing protein n=1 Tax=Saprolegnia diclina (strain VS20) TaxID=1156394 RepID=T0PSP4_SAPDV|nr:hypothetical protein SDRG_13837 [Saprolegnia diclina VS20]EQC28509.1 hypothetical protein SDRG_13837 [Saprolegnia diclina VS20]|eukprot:XP_008618157.1 hypothetical protein SDRG_13837 [Saprolegnia diclina VS20]
MMIAEGLAVRPSRLPNAGDGLFATKPFTPGDAVCVYTGDILTTSEALHVANKSYLMRLGQGVYVDARSRPNVAARYINDCRSRGVHNVVFEKDPALCQAIVRATRPIAVDDEIYVDYGTWYWLAYNMAHKASRIK